MRRVKVKVEVIVIVLARYPETTHIQQQAFAVDLQQVFRAGDGLGCAKMVNFIPGDSFCIVEQGRIFVGPLFRILFCLSVR